MPDGNRALHGRSRRDQRDQGQGRRATSPGAGRANIGRAARRGRPRRKTNSPSSRRGVCGLGLARRDNRRRLRRLLTGERCALPPQVRSTADCTPRSRRTHERASTRRKARAALKSREGGRASLTYGRRRRSQLPLADNETQAIVKIDRQSRHSWRCQRENPSPRDCGHSRLVRICARGLGRSRRRAPHGLLQDAVRFRLLRLPLWRRRRGEVRLRPLRVQRQARAAGGEAERWLPDGHGLCRMPQRSSRSAGQGKTQPCAGDAGPFGNKKAAVALPYGQRGTAARSRARRRGEG